jgi:hypothetical protein
MGDEASAASFYDGDRGGVVVAIKQASDGIGQCD